MKLIYRIAITLSAALTILMTAWAVLFYFATVDEINDETDDSLMEYSDDIIFRKLSGHELPSADNGTNNTYYIKEVTPEYADSEQWIRFSDEEMYITSKSEYESARVAKRIFVDSGMNYYELVVAVPTFEKEDLQRSILWWVVALYAILILSVTGLTLWVIEYNMRPFRALLDWLDGYNPGKARPPLPSSSGIVEFQKLSDAVGKAADRFENQFQEQKDFIGNASHELQTPLAACSNRIEYLLDSDELSESQATEIMKVQRSLQQLIRLNKTLLMLSRIEHGQFPESSVMDFSELVRSSLSMFGEIYAEKGLKATFNCNAPFVFSMNEQLSSILVNNLLKNAFVHSAGGADVVVDMEASGFSVSNPGDSPLDETRVFTRFYQGQHKKEGSTGLGLAITDSICRSYGLSIRYSYRSGCHVFAVSSKN